MMIVMPTGPLDTPVQFVRGVGPARAGLLSKLGLETVRDLLLYAPRDVLDLTEVKDVHDLVEGQLQSVRGTVVDIDGRDIYGNRTLSLVLLDCAGQYVRGAWFNQPWVLKKYQIGQQLLFSGKPARKQGRWEMAHPIVQVLDTEGEENGATGGGLLPRYGLTDGLRMHEIRRIVREAVEQFADALPEHLPDSFRRAHQLPALADAVRKLHLPASRSDYDAARRRIIFDDLLEFQLGLALRRASWKRHGKAPRLITTAKIDARIKRLFPFDLTPGQRQAVEEITADLAQDRAMHRLLQADVGAGKTAFALYTMLVAIAAGYQAVLMAPTEVLAQQHWGTIEAALAHSRVNRALLTGALTRAERKQTLDDIAKGEVTLIVGTQAVIQQDVRFNKLGVVVIDEQHKFGVMQRSHFFGGEQTPHVLVMTATPIPRSLCLTQFGDLDLTAMTDVPPGRQPVVTGVIPEGPERNRVWDFIREQLRAGRQAYVICPRIDGPGDPSDDEMDLSFAAQRGSSRRLAGGAEEVFRQLAARELADFKLGIVHGRVERSERTATMDAFARGQLDVLVATTVVEEGVDVPNATLMVVQHAERFGLSQLHQLRGRIARGKHRGYCFLFSDAASGDSMERLQAVARLTDGFQLAEADFELRGPGNVLGLRQHGELPLKTADLTRDDAILREARKVAFALVERGDLNRPEFAQLKSRVIERFGKFMDLPQTG